MVVGTPCAKAADEAKCKSTLASLTAGNGPPTTASCGGGCSRVSFLVTTAGDTVKKLEHGSDVVALYGPVQTAAEAALVVQIDVSTSLTCKSMTPSGADFDYTFCGDVALHPDGTSTNIGGAACAGRLAEGCSLSRPSGSVRTTGEWLATMAELERSAVDAFARMAIELRHHGAPEALVTRAEEARADETRHAGAMARQAERFGGRVRASTPAPMHARDLEAIAVENAVEGCVRETFGAILAAYQARTATDAELRRELAIIAADEARHAQLSWDLAAWIEPLLDADARANVERTRTQALASFHEAIALEADSQAAIPGLVALAGLPSREIAEALYEAARPTLMA
jgi:hypothetical protein